MAHEKRNPCDPDNPYWRRGGHFRGGCQTDISATFGHIVPTAVAFHGGTFHVGNLNTFPVVPGSSQVLDISRSGEILAATPGFTTIVGLAYRHRQLFALELSAAAGNPAPGAGKVVRLARTGSVEDMVTGLTLPTAMTFGPDGNLYVSNFGAVPGASGEIVQITLQPLETETETDVTSAASD